MITLNRLMKVNAHLTGFVAASLLLAWPIVAEEIRLTTYYPSPTGSFDAAEVNELTVHDLLISEGSSYFDDSVGIGIDRRTPGGMLHIENPSVPAIGGLEFWMKNLIFAPGPQGVPVSGGFAGNNGSVIRNNAGVSGACSIGFDLMASPVPSDGTPASFFVRTDSNLDGVMDTVALRINNAGNMGIKNTNPEEALDVTGRIRMSDGVISSGGNPRGIYATDLQTSRFLDSQVAAAPRSAITGGSMNLISSTSDFSFIGGGASNAINDTSGVDSYNGIVCGISNTITGSATYDSFIGGGRANTIRTYQSVIGGGWQNQIQAAAFQGVIGGGYLNEVQQYRSVIGGGYSNLITNIYGAIGGGYDNEAAGYGVVGGGLRNYNRGNYSVIPGGRNMTLTGFASDSFAFNGMAGSAYTLNTPNNAVFMVRNFNIGTTGPSGGLLEDSSTRLILGEGPYADSNSDRRWALKVYNANWNGVTLQSQLSEISPILGGVGNPYMHAILGSASSLSYQLVGLLGTQNRVLGINTAVYGAAFTTSGGPTGNILWVPDGPFSGQRAYAGYFNGDVFITRHINSPTSGRLGVGEPNPSQAVHVNGNVYASGWIYGATPYPSDVNLKQNFTPLTGALDQVLKLRGVEFEWRDDVPFPKPQGREIGMIAQEVEAVIPHATKTAEDGIKTLNYNSIVATLIEAVKEQQGEIKALKNRIESLEQ